MNAEQKLKMAKARQEAIDRYSHQVVSVDDNWQIIRSDQYNWEIQQKIKNDWVLRGFYGKLTTAFQALPAHMLNDSTKNSLEQCIDMLKAIKTSIDMTLKMKLPAD